MAYRAGGSSGSERHSVIAIGGGVWRSKAARSGSGDGVMA